METSSATGSPHAARRVLRSGGRRCTTLGLLALGVAVAVLAVAGGASADQPPPPGICLDVCLPPTQCADLRDNDGLRQHVAREMAVVQSHLEGMIVERPRRQIIRSGPTRNGESHAPGR